jgi:predicted Zn-dependent protease
MIALLRRLLTAFLVATLAAQPALAQSILRDAETEALFRDIARPLAEAGGVSPRSLQILLIGDPNINAFVTGGQNIFFHSGLISSADDVNQVQGVMAHELGHITGGHNVRFSEGTSAATGISLLSLLLGAAAIAAGAGDAGMGVMMAGQQAALGKFLAYTRTQESAADQAGASFLNKAGITGKGSLDFFRKLGNEEFRYGVVARDSYDRTHPLSSERITALEETYKASPAWAKPVDPALNARFLRVKAKLAGFVNEPTTTFRLYPESDMSEPARYARAYAYHKQAFPDKAVAEVDALLARHPADPYYLELKGQILLESGRWKDAIPSLRSAVRAAPGEPLLASLLASALIASEDKPLMAEAEGILKSAVARDNSNPFAWYQLGVIYDRAGDQPRAALASAERYNLMGAAPMALANARMAVAGLKQGTPDWLRAQDIEMVSRAEVEKDKKRRR